VVGRYPLFIGYKFLAAYEMFDLVLCCVNHLIFVYLV